MQNQKLTVDEVVAHFNRPVVVNEQGCWLWLGAVDRKGYARFGGHCIVYGAVWRMAGFTCGEGKELCHTCPNKNCINPDHIYAGTHKENMNDGNRQPMGPKGRLSQEQLVELNLMLLKGIPKGRIAAHFNVSPQWISKFLRGEFLYAQPCQTSE